jgi:hypothetical protein
MVAKALESVRTERSGGHLAADILTQARGAVSIAMSDAVAGSLASLPRTCCSCKEELVLFAWARVLGQSGQRAAARSEWPHSWSRSFKFLISDPERLVVAQCHRQRVGGRQRGVVREAL